MIETEPTVGDRVKVQRSEEFPDLLGVEATVERIFMGMRLLRIAGRAVWFEPDDLRVIA